MAISSNLILAIAPLPAPSRMLGKIGQVSGLVARGNFEVSMKWKDKNLQSLSFLSNVGGDLIVDYPNIEASQIKVNGKPVKATILKNNRIQLATKKVTSLPFEHFPGRVTSRQPFDKMESLLNLPLTKWRRYPLCHPKTSERHVWPSLCNQRICNQSNPLYRPITNPQLAYTYTVKAMLGELPHKCLNRPLSKPIASWWTTEIAVFSTELPLETGQTQNYLEEQKICWPFKRETTDEDLTATIPFTGVGIEIYGLKSSELGLATAKIDGKEVGELDFHLLEQLKKVVSSVASQDYLTDLTHWLFVLNVSTKDVVVSARKFHWTTSRS